MSGISSVDSHLSSSVSGTETAEQKSGISDDALAKDFEAQMNGHNYNGALKDLEQASKEGSISSESYDNDRLAAWKGKEEVDAGNGHEEANDKKQVSDIEKLPDIQESNFNQKME